MHQFDHRVVFRNDEFKIKGVQHFIIGTLNLNLKEKRLQLSDQIHIIRIGVRNPYGFNKLCKDWDSIERVLIKLIIRNKIFIQKK